MKTWIAVAALVGSAGMASAEMIAPTDVKFGDAGAVEQSLSGAPGDAANGALIVGDRSQGNCVACHMISALPDVPWQGEIGPPLDGAAERWTVEELRGIVANSKMTFPDTMMPSYYKTTGFIRPGDEFTGDAATEPLAPMLDAQMIEDVVAFLATLKQ